MLGPNQKYENIFRNEFITLSLALTEVSCDPWSQRKFNVSMVFSGPKDVEENMFISDMHSARVWRKFRKPSNIHKGKSKINLLHIS